MGAMSENAATDATLPAMDYARVGRSGLQLPKISVGLWQNFGDDRALDTMRDILWRAFELGITHFDLANNYGPPAGAAETNFGRVLSEDFAGLRNRLVISTKAGYRMWDGPYGEWGSRKYLLSSLDESLARMKIDYVDIFYSHRFDPDTPLEETMGALASAVQQGKALYAGISSYSPEATREAAAILRQMGVPCLIHQPSYSMFNRWIERGLLDVLGDEGIGCIAFSPLAQGLLSDKYLAPETERPEPSSHRPFRQDFLAPENLAKVTALNEIAAARGQTLSQMALAWCLRDARVTSALVGVSSVAQLEQNVGALARLDFSDEELARIDEHAEDLQLNIWRRSSEPESA